MNRIEMLCSVLNALNSIPVNGSNVFTMAGIMNTISSLIDDIKNEKVGGE